MLNYEPLNVKFMILTAHGLWSLYFKILILFKIKGVAIKQLLELI